MSVIEMAKAQWRRERNEDAAVEEAMEKEAASAVLKRLESWSSGPVDGQFSGDGTVTVEEVQFRAGGLYGLEMGVPCEECGKPVWVMVHGLADIGMYAGTRVEHHHAKVSKTVEEVKYLRKVVESGRGEANVELRLIALELGLLREAVEARATDPR